MILSIKFDGDIIYQNITKDEKELSEVQLEPKEVIGNESCNLQQKI